MSVFYDYQGNEVLSSNKTQQFEPLIDDVPMVFINGTLPTSKDQGNLPVTVNYCSAKKNFSNFATLKVQGDSSANYPKKNFTIKLFEDSNRESKSKLSFRDWAESNKFVLKANWIDHTHARNVVNARLWSQIVRSRSDFITLPEELQTANLAIDGFPVRVFNNGIYQGLYTWNIPKDGMYNVDDDIDSNCIINSESNGDQSCAFNGTTMTNWSDELHDSMPTVISTGWQSVLSFVSTASDSDFVANINDYIDLQSVIDFDIFARVICLVDNLCKNQIFFTYNGTKWYEGAYDLDGTWGLPPTVRSWFAYNTVFQDGYVAYMDLNVENKLYTRVETLFTAEFKARYTELRESVLSEDNIIYQFETFINAISSDLYALDYAETTAGGAFVNIPFKTQSNLEQIKEFVPLRLAYMDSVVEAL